MFSTTAQLESQDVSLKDARRPAESYWKLREDMAGSLCNRIEHTCTYKG